MAALVYQKGVHGNNDKHRSTAVESSAQGVASSDNSWRQPEPIGDVLPPVRPCDPEHLPQSFGGAATDIAERMQVPLDVVAAALISTLAGAVNRRPRIQPKAQDDQWYVVPNLWGGIIGTPGVMKTPVIEAAARSLTDLQARHTESHSFTEAEYQRESERFGLEREAWTQVYKKWVKNNREGEPPVEPLPPQEISPAARFVLTDARFEALHKVMAENAAGVYVLRNELTGWLSMLDRSGREGERAFCLEAWSGTTSYTMDRIGRGTIHVPHCCMRLFVSIQPARLRAYLRDAVQDGPSNDGLAQRLQVIVWPDIDKSWRLVDRPCNQQALERVAAVLGALVELPASAVDTWRFSSDAQTRFNEWFSNLERRLRGDEVRPALASHFSKYKSLMPSLALLFELADRAVVDDVHRELLVSISHVEQPIQFCAYLETHAARVYSCVTSPETTAGRELVSKLKAGKLPETFSLRDAYRPLSRLTHAIIQLAEVPRLAPQSRRRENIQRRPHRKVRARQRPR